MLIYQIICMNFLNLSEVVEAVDVHEQFQHEIKGKRIKKELSNLQEYQNQHITFKRYFISLAGLSFFVEAHVEQRMFDFEVLIDFDYPFNRPKIFFIHEHSPYGHAQDLLDSILEGHNWGPSMLLSTIFDKLHFIASYIEKESENLIASYEPGDLFDQEVLVRYRVELFKIEQYKWKYLIKSTHQKVLGLTKQTMLIFTATSEEPGKLKLETSIRIKSLKEANASISGAKFKMDIGCSDAAPQSRYYFGGDKQDMEKILYFMNPIQVTERQLSKPEKQNYEGEQLQKVIEQYSDLIEYYSLRDQEKTKKYVNLVQELIKKNYQNEIKQEKKMQEIQEDIKT